MPPSSAAPTLPRRALVALVLALGFGLGAPASAQVPTTTTPGVLVPGDPTATTVTTTTAPSATSEPTGEEKGLLDFDLDANEKVWIIVGALVAVALLLLVLTIIYWRHTKPDRPAAVTDEGKDDRASRKERKRRRKAKVEHPVTDTDTDTDSDGAAEPVRDRSSAPLDLDDLPGSPDPARSVFGAPDEPSDSSR